MREEDLPQAQDAEEEEEADDSPGNRTDMELAWENLEVAKLIYERENAASYAKELAGKHFPPISLSASDNVAQPTCFCMQLQQVHAFMHATEANCIDCLSIVDMQTSMDSLHWHGEVQKLSSGPFR